MKKILGIISLSLTILVVNEVSAQSYSKGLEAAKRGDFAVAFREWEPLAIKGNVNAQRNLAYMYSNGDGVKQDYKKAAIWYQKAAKQGDVDAQYSLGELYHKGVGVEQDYDQAAKLYSLAAKKGNAEAQKSLGTMYYHGEGVRRSDVHALMWISIASSNGVKSPTRKLLLLERMAPEHKEQAQVMAKKCLESKYVKCE